MRLRSKIRKNCSGLLDPSSKPKLKILDSGEVRVDIDTDDDNDIDNDDDTDDKNVVANNGDNDTEMSSDNCSAEAARLFEIELLFPDSTSNSIAFSQMIKNGIRTHDRVVMVQANQAIQNTKGQQVIAKAIRLRQRFQFSTA